MLDRSKNAVHRSAYQSWGSNTRFQQLLMPQRHWWIFKFLPTVAQRLQFSISPLFSPPAIMSTLRSGRSGALRTKSQGTHDTDSMDTVATNTVSKQGVKRKGRSAASKAPAAQPSNASTKRVTSSIKENDGLDINETKDSCSSGTITTSAGSKPQRPKKLRKAEADAMAWCERLKNGEVDHLSRLEVASIPKYQTRSRTESCATTVEFKQSVHLLSGTALKSAFLPVKQSFNCCIPLSLCALRSLSYANVGR